MAKKLQQALLRVFAEYLLSGPDIHCIRMAKRISMGFPVMAFQSGLHPKLFYYNLDREPRTPQNHLLSKRKEKIDPYSLFL
jgi:hypothetical protein